VVLGPIADQVATEIRAALAHAPTRAEATPMPTAPTASRRATPALASAVGGADNIRSLALGGGRLLLELEAPGAIDAQALASLGVRGIARPGARRLQLLHATPEDLLADG